MKINAKPTSCDAAYKNRYVYSEIRAHGCVNFPRTCYLFVTILLSSLLIFVVVKSE